MTQPMRPGHTPPRPLTEEEIAVSRPDELEKAIRNHEQHAERLAREDPGRGLPRPEAQAARERQLREVNRHAAEVERLRIALGPDPDSKEAQRERMVAAHAGHRRPGQPLSALDPEMQQFYRDIHEASEEKRMEREQKQEERLRREREEHPPDARAASVTAAVCADDALVDALEVKPRPTSVSGVDAGMQTISQLEIIDVGVLVASLRLLEEVRPFKIRNWAQGPKWPQRKPPVASTKNLRESLARLKGAGFVKITAQGGEALIDYGETTLAIANEWGLELTETKEMATA